MTTYEQSDFERIATAIGMDVAQIAKHQNLFEMAAAWYRLDRSRPNRTAPSRLRRKLEQISKSARRLLKNLGVNHPDEAADGPGDPEILNALVLLGEATEDPIIEATQRIGRLTEIIDGVAAVAESAKLNIAPAIRIDLALIERFGRGMREKFTAGSVPFRKAYLQSLIDVVEVDDHRIRIKGNKDVLERAVLAGQTAGESGSQMSTRWRARRDSNS